MNGTMPIPECTVEMTMAALYRMLPLRPEENHVYQHAHKPARIYSEFRMYGCHLCEKTVSIFMQVPLHGLRAPTRSCASVAFARQVAMYLAHTKIGLMYTEVGNYFGRDRTTVTHACHMIEDCRDNREFDRLVENMEEIIGAAIPCLHNEFGRDDQLLISVG